MFSLWNKYKISLLSLFLLTSCLFFISCAAKQESEKETYNERRLEKTAGELNMESMTYYSLEESEESISPEILSIIHEEGKDERWFYYDSETMKIVLLIEGNLENPARIWIQGREYPYSFGGGYYPGWTEAPEICFYDVNKDGLPDLLFRGEAYRNWIRQEVYLSRSDGSYQGLGDITWTYGEESRGVGENSSYQILSFSATYEEKYQVHVIAAEQGIDRMIDIGETFRPVAQDLGYYDRKGNLGQEIAPLEDLQSQAVRYILKEDGSVELRYEAQIWTGYSEYCLGHCFVFSYLITEGGYQIQDITLEEFEY